MSTLSSLSDADRGGPDWTRTVSDGADGRAAPPTPNGLSGFEVCKKLRADPKTKDLLILMVTALNEASDFERGVQAGTDDFLTKPVNKIELLCRIRSILRVRHLKTQLDRTLAYVAEYVTASRESATGP